MNYTRRVAVDDTDSQLSWSGPWITSKDHPENLQGAGPPFLYTMHGILGQGSVSFTYEGE